MKNLFIMPMIVISSFLLLSCSSSKAAPTDATLFQGHFYKVIEMPCSWQKAEIKCREMGGMLASIKNEDVNDFIIRLSAGKCLWLGGSDQIQEGAWLWRDGSPVTFTHWAPGEPDDWKGREDWLVIGWPGDRFKNGRWGDTKPFARSPIVGFICEWQ